MKIHPLRPRDHEDAARTAITWLADRHRKGWRMQVEASAGAGPHWELSGAIYPLSKLQ